MTRERETRAEYEGSEAYADLRAALCDRTIFLVETVDQARDYWHRQAQRVEPFLASERSRADRLEQDLERVKTGLREVEHISAACFAQDPDEGYEAIRDLSRRLLASVEENRHG